MARYSTLAIATLAAGLTGMSGCANLDVRKVPVNERAASADGHRDGFRYYLTRPYVAVLKPIPVATKTTLVARKKELPPNVVLFAEGPRAGERVNLDQLTVRAPGSTAVYPVTPVELEGMQAVLSNKPAVIRDSALRQVADEVASTLPNTSSLNRVSPAAGIGEDNTTNLKPQVLSDSAIRIVELNREARWLSLILSLIVV